MPAPFRCGDQKCVKGCGQFPAAMTPCGAGTGYFAAAAAGSLATPTVTFAASAGSAGGVSAGSGAAAARHELNVIREVFLEVLPLPRMDGLHVAAQFRRVGERVGRAGHMQAELLETRGRRVLGIQEALERPAAPGMLALDRTVGVDRLAHEGVMHRERPAQHQRVGGVQHLDRLARLAVVEEADACVDGAGVVALGPSSASRQAAVYLRYGRGLLLIGEEGVGADVLLVVGELDGLEVRCHDALSIR